MKKSWYKYIIYASVIFLVIAALVTVTLPQVFAAEFEVYTNQQIYSTPHPLFIYGTGDPNTPLVLRLYTPDGSTAEFKQVIVNSDGTFNLKLLDWPKFSTTFPYGTYTVEAIPQSGPPKKIDIKFASSTELKQIPIERDLNTQVFAPEIAAINKPFRVFVQVTSDGLMVSSESVKVPLKNPLGIESVSPAWGFWFSLSHFPKVYLLRSKTNRVTTPVIQMIKDKTTINSKVCLFIVLMFFRFSLKK